jgi:N-methylhydantoinase B
MGLINMWSTSVMKQFLDDLYGYTEFLMRQEIDKIPEGTYYGESFSDGIPGTDSVIAIRCNTTIKGSNIIIDLSESDPLINYYMNSTIANTYSSVFIALMTSVGRTIEYRSEGVMKPVEIRTKPGTLAHATYPAPVGLCTVFLAKQIIEAVWDSLARVIPNNTPAGWGSWPAPVFSGFDPRRNEGYASPDFLAVSTGSGAIWGTDGWHAGQSPICAGGLSYPEIEICESKYPAIWKRWEIITDSAGAGKWRGGAGMESTFLLEADEMTLCHHGNGFRTFPSPAVAGGKKPLKHSRQILFRSNGEKEEGGGKLYVLRMGETQACYCMGGCGVGDPLERDSESVRLDVIDGIVSLDNARELYGVVLNPKTLKVNKAQTEKLRLKKKTK